MLFSYSIVQSFYKHVFKDSDQCLLPSCDWWLYIVFVHSLWDGSIWPGPGYPVCAHEGSVELALHRERPEDCQTAVWDPHWKVCINTINRTRLRCNQSLIASWIQSRFIKLNQLFGIPVITLLMFLWLWRMDQTCFTSISAQIVHPCPAKAENAFICLPLFNQRPRDFRDVQHISSLMWKEMFST